MGSSMKRPNVAKEILQVLDTYPSPLTPDEISGITGIKPFSIKSRIRVMAFEGIIGCKRAASQDESPSYFTMKTREKLRQLWRPTEAAL